jgi:hypothetical protein
MQKAKLELPIKQFHKLHDFLGMILDYEYENYTFNLENLEIDLIEDIRHELFNQIPDELPIETTYAWTTAQNARFITPIKLYEVKDFSDSGLGFHITSDRGGEIFCIKNGCAHLSEDKNKNWNFTTITND